VFLRSAKKFGPRCFNMPLERLEATRVAGDVVVVAALGVVDDALAVGEERPGVVAVREARAAPKSFRRSASARTSTENVIGSWSKSRRSCASVSPTKSKAEKHDTGERQRRGRALRPPDDVQETRSGSSSTRSATARGRCAGAGRSASRARSGGPRRRAAGSTTPSRRDSRRRRRRRRRGAAPRRRGRRPRAAVPHVVPGAVVAPRSRGGPPRGASRSPGRGSSPTRVRGSPVATSRRWSAAPRNFRSSSPPPRPTATPPPPRRRRPGSSRGRRTACSSARRRRAAKLRLRAPAPTDARSDIVQPSFNIRLRRGASRS